MGRELRGYGEGRFANTLPKGKMEGGDFTFHEKNP